MLVLLSLMLELEPALSRVGAEARRRTSLLSSDDLTRSKAFSSDGRRKCCGSKPGREPGVEGGMLARDGVDAAEDVDVAGEGGPPPEF